MHVPSWHRLASGRFGRPNEPFHSCAGHCETIVSWHRRSPRMAIARIKRSPRRDVQRNSPSFNDRVPAKSRPAFQRFSQAPWFKRVPVCRRKRFIRCFFRLNFHGELDFVIAERVNSYVMKHWSHADENIVNTWEFLYKFVLPRKYCFRPFHLDLSRILSKNALDKNWITARLSQKIPSCTKETL